MSIPPKDLNMLRTFAARYAEIACQDVQKERLDRYYKTTALEWHHEPPVWVQAAGD